MSINPALMSSKTGEHGTPHSLMIALASLGMKFDIDICASLGRAVAPFFFAPPETSEGQLGQFINAQVESDYISGAVCAGIDAFKQSWASHNWSSLTGKPGALGWSWMNPPYGRGIAKWLKFTVEQQRKNVDEHLCGAQVAALIPARTDTKWWHDYVAPNAEVWFFRGRLRFRDAAGNEQDPAPFPSALALFRQELSTARSGVLKFGDPSAKLNQGRFEVIRVLPDGWGRR